MHVNFHCGQNNKRLTCDEVFLQRMFQSIICCHGWATRSIPPRKSEEGMDRLPITASCRCDEMDFSSSIAASAGRRTRHETIFWLSANCEKVKEKSCAVLFTCLRIVCMASAKTRPRVHRGGRVERLFEFFVDRFLRCLTYTKYNRLNINMMLQQTDHWRSRGRDKF